MQVTDKQRKLIWAGAALLGVFYIAPWAIRNARIAFSDPPAPAKPSAARILPIAPKPTPEQQLQFQAGRALGDWKGGGVLPERGPCKISLQIRRDPMTPDGFTGYATSGCNPLFTTAGMSKQAALDHILKGATPTSSIMSGKAVKGDLIFHVDKAIGTPADGCPWSDVTVSPFGEQVAIDWQVSGPCKGGQMVLNRVTNVQ